MIEKLRRIVAFRRFNAGTEPETFRPSQSAPKSAREAFFQMVDEVALDDRLPFDLAMAKVKAQRPDVVAAAFSPVCRRPCGSQVERQLLAA